MILGLISNVSYEEICNIPCSAKIFSNNENNNSWVTKDLDWNTSANKNPYLSAYWANEYAFNDYFNINEYYSYNVNLNLLNENSICISANDFFVSDSKGNPNAMNIRCCWTPSYLS